MSKRKGLLLTMAAAIAVAGVVWACGPDFPNQLLTDRAATLGHVPANTFAFEAAQLVPASDALKANEPPPYEDDAARAKREAALNAGLDDVQLRQLGELSGMSGEQAWQHGADLPQAIRLYAAAAADFHAGSACAAVAEATAGSAEDAEDEGAQDAAPANCDTAAPWLDQAAARFQAVLDLPADQRQLRAVAGAYMLGRIRMLQLIDCAACKPDELVREVHRQFGAAREMASHGAPDPLGLAVASYGEEARLHLRRQGGVGDGSADGRFCRWQGFLTDATCPATIAPADYQKAIALYAAQAARGSRSGVDSLRLLARYALDHPTLSKVLVGDASSRQLLVAYALAAGVGDAAAATRLQTLADAIQQQGIDQLAGADRLASLAYGIGRYELAASLVKQSNSPLASWVSAKLALHRGDLAAADAAYAQAIKGFPQQGASTLDAGNPGLLRGEHGVLALARGDYVEAMSHLYDAAQTVGGDGNSYNYDGGDGAGYGNDVQYLAERVLSTDELIVFVDAHVPASALPAATEASPDSYVPRPLADNLRWLLARRLMRAGRYEAAQAYFPRPTDHRFGSDDLPSLARAYAAGLHQAAHAWTSIGRAEGWYQAAVIAREHGMELLGYAQDPDYQFVDGEYDAGAGLSSDELKGSYVTADERSRHAQTQAQPDRRFHYRYIAADQASHAADLLPPRSQAFVAVLCHATGWMLAGPPDYHDQFPSYGEPAPTGMPERIARAEALYQRYVREGPHVSWATDFGRHCAAPNFDAARALLREQRIAHVRQLARAYRGYGIGAFVLLLGGLGWWLQRRRKARPVG